MLDAVVVRVSVSQCTELRFHVAGRKRAPDGQLVDPPPKKPAPDPEEDAVTENTVTEDGNPEDTTTEDEALKNAQVLVKDLHTGHVHGFESCIDGIIYACAMDDTLSLKFGSYKYGGVNVMYVIPSEEVLDETKLMEQLDMLMDGEALKDKKVYLRMQAWLPLFNYGYGKFKAAGGGITSDTRHQPPSCLVDRIKQYFHSTVSFLLPDLRAKWKDGTRTLTFSGKFELFYPAQLQPDDKTPELILRDKLVTMIHEKFKLNA